MAPRARTPSLGIAWLAALLLASPLSGCGESHCPESAPDVCGLACTDLSTDADNCGSCGNACATGLTCSAGACGCSDGSKTLCDGGCVDLQGDSSNCGTCGRACESGYVCSSGTCRLSCSGTTPDACGTSCTDLATDASNCGTCGNACGTGQACSSGACVCTDASQTLCSGTCVDLQTDASSCGSCGNACGSGQACSSGACVCTGGTTNCAGVCVDTQTDADNCGACGTACPTGRTCSSGTCTTASTTSVVLDADFETVPLGMVDATDATVSGVAVPTVTNTNNYSITLTGKLRVTTTQALPATGSDDTWTIGVVQFANATSSIGTLTISDVACPFTLTVHHAPTTPTDTARQLLIKFGGNQVYLGGGGVGTATGIPGYSVTLDSTTTSTTCTSGTTDIYMYGWNGSSGAGVRIYDVWIEQ